MAKIILTINEKDFENESGKKLDEAMLKIIAEQVNADSAFIMGYESYEYKLD